MRRRWIAGLCVMLAVGTAGAGAVRAAGAEDFDAAGFLKQLGDAATRQQALAKLPTLPEAALVPLTEARDDPSTPTALAQDLAANLPALYAHCREERRKQDAAQDDAWMNKQLVEPYRSTHTGDKADDAVLKAFTALSTGRGTYAIYKAAVDAGSDDPVVRFCWVVEGIASCEMPVEQAIKQISPVLDAMDASEYSNGVKFLLHCRLVFVMRSADWPAGMPQKTNVRDEIENCMVSLPTYLAEKPSRPRLRAAVSDCMDLLASQLGDRKKAYDRLAPLLQRALPGDALTNEIEADFDEWWAWDARGSGVGATVTDEAWKLFDERLGKCAAAATEGWRRDPLSPQCACSMIAVVQGLSQGDEVMEKWFRRATLADPDYLNAYSRKAYYLAPQWHGDRTQALEFGRACVKEGNGRNRIPMVLVEVWKNLVEQSDHPDAVLRRPEAWSDIRSVYEKLLADRTRLTDDRAAYLSDRMELVMWAWKCQQWQAFGELSKEFGDEMNVAQIGGSDRLDLLEREAAALAKDAAGADTQPGE